MISVLVLNPAKPLLDLSLLEMVTLNVATKHGKGKPNKRWSLAFATIYYARALFSLLDQKKKENGRKLLPPTRNSFVLIDVEEPEASFSSIDKTALAAIVKEQNLDQLGGIEGVASALETNIRSGISTTSTSTGAVHDVALRQKAFGSNTYQRPPTKSLMEGFKDITVLILLLCAALSLGLGIKEHGLKEGWYDGGGIFVAVILTISPPAVSNFLQNRQLEKFFKVNSNTIKVNVVRDGKPQQIPIFEIVAGDVVFLNTGDQVPADGLLFDGHQLQVDESSLTWEGVTTTDCIQVKSNRNPFLLFGSKVVAACEDARMLVTSVGMNTTRGAMMTETDINEETPLQAWLNKFASSIAKPGLAVLSFLIVVALLVRYFTGNTENEKGNQEFVGSSTKAGAMVNSMVRIIAVAVTIGLVAIPEGLSWAVAIILAYSGNGMIADKVIVRKRSACETMGSATTICILTLNQMKVKKFWLGQDPIGEDPNSSSIATNVLNLIQQGVALNTTGRVYRATSGSNTEFCGSPSEKAILSWASLKLGMEMEKLKQNYTILLVEAFNSEKKRSGVSIRSSTSNKDDNSTIHVHWKGAAEIILAMCSSYYDVFGRMKDMDGNERRIFEKIIEDMAANSLRCLALAHVQIPDQEEHELKEDGLALIGLVGIEDPCRPEVRKAVDDCQKAGVNVTMVTGDNVFAAREIAIECGILRPEDQDMNNTEAVVEGEVFRNYTSEERLEKVEKIRVMARSSPCDKLLMVQCLKEKCHVVAVTGGGTNDSQALKEANIGLCMGIMGTQVAKESSDIIILDDNFASIPRVLGWGRCVYNNIQKIIQLQLTVNIAALVINIVEAVSACEIPFTVMKLLWVNLIIDTLGALALATEQPTKELLMEKPPPVMSRTTTQAQPLITNIMWRNILFQALYQVVAILILQFSGESIFHVNEKVKDTMTFSTSVLCQVFNQVNARRLEKKKVFKGIHKNKLFLGIIGMTIILQMVVVEFLKKFTDTESLSLGQWGACLGIAVLSWPIGWVVKCIPVSDKPFVMHLSSLVEF